MSAFVIAKRGTELLDTSVFHSGASGSEQAIAVFSDGATAQRYVAQAGWADDHEVGELNDLQLLRWTVQAHAEKTRYLLIDPDRERQLAGEQQESLVIEEILAVFAESLTRDILKAIQESGAG